MRGAMLLSAAPITAPTQGAYAHFTNCSYRQPCLVWACWHLQKACFFLLFF